MVKTMIFRTFNYAMLTGLGIMLYVRFALKWEFRK